MRVSGKSPGFVGPATWSWFGVAMMMRRTVRDWGISNNRPQDGELSRGVTDQHGRRQFCAAANATSYPIYPGVKLYV